MREQLRKLLDLPFRGRSRRSSPIDSNTPASSGIASPAHATRSQSPDFQSPAFSVPEKNQAFQKAIQEYIDNLSEDDKVAFQSATDVMEKLEELQRATTHKSSSHTTRMQKVQKVLQCLKRFVGSIAICIQHHPEISSLVVGGFNCILTVSIYIYIFTWFIYVLL